MLSYYLIFYFVYSEKARALDEMEQRHAEKMTEMNAALSAKDAEAGSVRSKLEQAEKDAINQKEMLSTSAQKAAKEAEARVSAEIVKMKAQLDAKDKELNTVKTEVTGLRKAADQNTDAQARLKDLAKQKEALEKEKQMMVSFRKGVAQYMGNVIYYFYGHFIFQFVLCMIS